ncbi:NlpC/P60 family protein [Reichenbachiella faecimaris]|uniref:NlpC/P60 family protein n=1 Tax=Reichenbachiella faecimaris TaxID=692418 RepID=A0A1W2G633_REIFA|nr:NlpC/P60 family protein [Reichenbachiella faecimaris]SMD32139.1 NlpC/P60 family protein [Reichenbachiella faecimaris]
MNESPKGICRLSVVAMRTTAKSDASLVSQLLFGEHYTVLEEKNDMLKIQLHYDNSEGWISKNQHTSISNEYFNQVNLSDYKVCIDLSGTIYFQKKHVHILFGSVLPITTNELFKLEEQVAFNGESKSLSQKREFEYMKEVMKKYLNAPYLTGGKTPFGVDAGGFIQQVFKVCGYRLPRTIDEQMKSGQEVHSIDSIIPGDLVFSANKPEVGYIFLGGDDYAGIYGGEVKKIGLDDLGESGLKARRILLKKLTPEQA